MTFINRRDYAVRKIGVAARDWWLVKHESKINVGVLHLPKEFVGKKVRLHVELYTPQHLRRQNTNEEE